MCIVLSLVTLGYTIKEWHYPTHMRGWLVVGWGVHRSQLLYVFVFAAYEVIFHGNGYYIIIIGGERVPLSGWRTWRTLLNVNFLQMNLVLHNFSSIRINA